MFNPEIFAPGTRVKLVALGTVHSRLATNFVGYKVDKYLVIEWPKVSGAPARIEEGLEWTVSYIHEGFIYGFNAQVLGISRQPVPLVFMTYPKSVEKTNLRQERRLPVHLQAMIQPSGEERKPNEPINGMVRDISDGGCQLVATMEYQPGSRVDLVLHVSDTESIGVLAGEVMSSRQLGANYLMGLRFVFSDSSDIRRRFHELMRNLRTTPLRV